MWSGLLDKNKQGRALREDMVVLINFPVDCKGSKYCEEIYIVAGVPNPGGAPYSTTEKQKLVKPL